MEYRIVSGDTEKELVVHVNEMIEIGWETEGGVAISPDGRFYQAMILLDEDEDFEKGEFL